MAAEKRPASDAFGSSQLVVKRQKSNIDVGNAQAVAVSDGRARPNGALVQASFGSLERSELSGHTGEIFATRFDPTGNLIASGSMDRSISTIRLSTEPRSYADVYTLVLWRTYGQCENYGVLTGHKGAVLDLHWSRNSEVIFSASADMTLASWDLETGFRIRRYEGHEEVVNCLDVSKRGEELLVSGSDDGFIYIWDSRQKRAIDEIATPFPVTSIALSEAMNELYTGSIDNDIRVWDMRHKSIYHTMSGHTDTVTSLHISSDNQALLSYGHDGTARTWNIQAFAPTDRQMQSYVGAHTGLEKNFVRARFNSKGDRIIAGSGDGTVVVWDVQSTKLSYKLPGHKGVVNDVDFAPHEPISKTHFYRRIHLFLSLIRPSHVRLFG
ncbi:MAG: hypothetical protein Q9214_004409 [Letrouitia sp. 1 TL-2023]